MAHPAHAMPTKRTPHARKRTRPAPREGKPTTIDVRVGARRVSLVVDHDHIEAHRRDFAIPLAKILGYAARALIPGAPGIRVLASRDGPGSALRWIEAPLVVGWAGVIPAGAKAFWGYRLGRKTPSHLVHGRKRRTRHLTMYGTWETADRFHLRTVYAGDATPREIHDPQIPPQDLDAAIAFWGTHAIVVVKGDYTTEPAKAPAGPGPPWMPKARRPR